GPVLSTVKRHLSVILSESQPLPIGRNSNTNSGTQSFVGVHRNFCKNFLRIKVAYDCSVAPPGIIVTGINKKAISWINRDVGYIVCCERAENFLSRFNAP